MARHAATTARSTAQTERGRSADRRPDLTRPERVASSGTSRAVSPQAERHVRTAWSLPLFASVVSLAFVLVAITDHSPSVAVEATAPAPEHQVQMVASTSDYLSDIELAQWKTSRVVVYGVAPAAGTPDPGTAMAIALTMVDARGWSSEQYDCLVSLWNKESRWNAYANNPSSGAYGIPQALPGSKMASAGADWATNPATQITWGLGYIQARYGDPCGAWGHSQRVGWY